MPENKIMNFNLAYLKRIFSAYVLNKKTSNLAFWHTPLRANNLCPEDLESLRAYPQNYEDKIGRITTVDNKGVIMLDYKGDLGMQYNPNAVAQLALGYYDRILAGEDKSEEFLRQASFFIDHGREVDDGVLLWEYKFPFQMRNFLESPWRSALAQGQGVSVCLRAYTLGGGERYLDAADRAFKSFTYQASDHPGGVLDGSRGYTWLEEYIVKPPNHVLNGFIWALWGVRDYAVFHNHDAAWTLWSDCLKTLKENLEHYDLKFWTTYDLVRFDRNGRPTMPVSIYYQNLHVVQMEAMYNLTGDQVFKHYQQRWKRQLDGLLNRMLSQAWKAYFKIRWF